jgi:hypothetical protein
MMFQQNVHVWILFCTCCPISLKDVGPSCSHVLTFFDDMAALFCVTIPFYVAICIQALTREMCSFLSRILIFWCITCVTYTG